MARALVIDIDGVVRTWAPLTDDEHRLGLPPGAILRAAFEPTRLHRVITGRMTDAEWRAGVARELTDTYAADGAAAVAAWSEMCGVADPAVVAVLRRARRTLTVAALSNATDRLAADLARLGLGDAFDLVLNSSELGVAKPDPEVFRRAAELLGRRPDDCLFVDDSAANAEAATAVGMVAHHYRDVAGLETFLAGHIRLRSSAERRTGPQT